MEIDLIIERQAHTHTHTHTGSIDPVLIRRDFIGCHGAAETLQKENKREPKISLNRQQIVDQRLVGGGGRGRAAGDASGHRSTALRSPQVTRCVDRVLVWIFFLFFLLGFY